MTELKTALAIGAHPDDVEFGMAGTLSLLKEAGYQPHILTIARGDCGTADQDPGVIMGIRHQEAENAAEVIGAVYHPGLVKDLMIYYEDTLLRRVCAIVREIQPEIVLCPSLVDYMEDHQNAGRLAVSAVFCRGLRNYDTHPPRSPAMNDVYVYHANPHGNRDPLRRRVVPGLFVDISDQIGVKEEMLRRHESQKKWLDVSQGMDSYLATMRDLSAQIARMSGIPSIQYAEGFRRHLHLGFSTKDHDKLKEVLGEKVIINQACEDDLG